MGNKAVKLSACASESVVVPRVVAVFVFTGVVVLKYTDPVVSSFVFHEIITEVGASIPAVRLEMTGASVSGVVVLVRFLNFFASP